MSAASVKPVAPLVRIGVLLLDGDGRMFVRFGSGPLVLLESRALSAAHEEARKLAGAGGIAP